MWTWLTFISTRCMKCHIDGCPDLSHQWPSHHTSAVLTLQLCISLLSHCSVCAHDGPLPAGCSLSCPARRLVEIGLRETEIPIQRAGAAAAECAVREVTPSPGHRLAAPQVAGVTRVTGLISAFIGRGARAGRRLEDAAMGPRSEGVPGISYLVCLSATLIFYSCPVLAVFHLRQ